MKGNNKTVMGLMAALLATTFARQTEEARQAKTVGAVDGIAPSVGPARFGGTGRPYSSRCDWSRGRGGPGNFATPAGQRKLARRSAAEVRRVEGLADHQARRKWRAEARAREVRIREIEAAA